LKESEELKNYNNYISNLKEGELLETLIKESNERIESLYDQKNNTMNKKFEKIIERIYFIKKKVENSTNQTEKEYKNAIMDKIMKRGKSEIFEMIRGYDYNESLDLLYRDKCNKIIELCEKEERMIMSEFGNEVLEKYFNIFKNGEYIEREEIENLFSFLGKISK
jgi:replicative DNA helicase